MRGPARNSTWHLDLAFARTGELEPGALDALTERLKRQHLDAVVREEEGAVHVSFAVKAAFAEDAVGLAVWPVQEAAPSGVGDLLVIEVRTKAGLRRQRVESSHEEPLGAVSPSPPPVG